MRYRHSITITVVRPGGVDRFGDPLPSSEHEITDVVKFPRSSTGSASFEQDSDFSNTVTIGYTLLPPPGADILSSDRVRLPGDAPDTADWEVDGEVADWGPSPFSGWTPGGQVAIKRVQ